MIALAALQAEKFLIPPLQSEAKYDNCSVAPMPTALSEDVIFCLV